MIFHVLNRGNSRDQIFHKEADFLAFEKVMAETMERVPMRIISYCLMPNHWHLVLWPKKREERRGRRGTSMMLQRGSEI